MVIGKIFPVVVLSLALSACGGADTSNETIGNVVNVAESAENPANGAADVANAANIAATAPAAAETLSRYVGKYPFDKVDGQSWDSDPAIKAAVTAAVPDGKIREWVLDGAGPTTPIVQQDGKILSWACEQHNCGPHNWATLIDARTGAAEVCYYDSASDSKQARWFKAGKESRRDGECPSGDNKVQ